MTIWILRPVANLPSHDDPWEPWYDKVFGFVVRAESEEDARNFAHADAGAENRGEFLRQVTANTNSPWLDSKYSTCEPLSSDGEPGVVMQDMASA